MVDHVLTRSPAPRKNRRKPCLGQVFGRLTVIEEVDAYSHHGRLVKAMCSCGSVVIKRIDTLRTGNTLSCGCLAKEAPRLRPTAHGLKRTPEYRAWSGMHDRCGNPNGNSFEDYMGRGITVCERWKSFLNFLADMGVRPSSEHSLDRRDNDGNYEPGNCRWATAEEQAHNRRPRRWRRRPVEKP